MLSMIRRLLSRAALAALGLLSAHPSFAENAVPAGNFGAWSLFTTDVTGQKLCFATSQPTSSEPKGANRGPARAFVSAWPKDGVKTEISMKLGFPIKKESEVSVGVGTESYTLFPKDERAFVSDPTQELKLLEAMKKGSMLVVQATSERGTAVTDIYSLQGFTQAVQALGTACP
jgi:invasion protein IalB